MTGAPPEFQTAAWCIAAFGAGVAAVLAFLDRREASLKSRIEQATNVRMVELEARVAKLEGKHEEARGIALEGIAVATDHDCRDRLVKIAKVLD